MAGEGSYSSDAHEGRQHGLHPLTPFYLPVFCAATFAWDFSSISLQAPAWAKGGALQYCPPPSSTATPRWVQAVQGWQLVPPPWQAGWSGYAAPLAQGTPVLPHCPSPREAEQGLSTPGCPVTQRAPAVALGSTAAMRGCKALRKRGALGMGDFQALSYAAPKEAAARAASASPASLWFHATPAHLPVLGGGLRGLG